MKKRINNGVFYVVISLALMIGVAGVVGAFTGNASRVIENVEVYNEATQPESFVDEGRLGAVPSPDVYQRMNFHAGYQSGGTRLATPTTAATYTLAVGDIKEDTVFWDVNVGLDTTITTMASSSLAMDAMNIPNAGDTRELYVYSATTTTATTLTLAAGTGVDLQKNEDTADLAINGLDVAKLIFIRKADTDVMLIMEEWVVAD